jgi:CBS domain-containing protein
MGTLEANPTNAEALRAFRVRDAMHAGVITCAHDTPLGEVARLMATHRVHAIVALGEDTDLWGVVTDLDLVSLVAAGEHCSAADAAATDVLPVAPDDTLEHAAQLMREHAATHLVVVDPASQRPLGVLSTLDVAGTYAGVRTMNGTSAMRVEDVMTRDVATVSPETSLKAVAALLVDRDISGVPVVEDGKLRGVVSERDLLAKERGDLGKPDGLLGWFLGEDVDAEKHWARTAGEAMTSPAVTIDRWRSTSAAAGIMAERGLKRLPVVHDGELVGIVTRRDLVRAFARGDAEIARDITDQVLQRSFWLPPDTIRVTVRGGDVTLEGEVDSEAVQAALAAEVARVPGVVSVETRVRVSPT